MGSQSFGGLRTVGLIKAASFGSGDACGTGPRLFKVIHDLSERKRFKPNLNRK